MLPQQMWRETWTLAQRAVNDCMFGYGQLGNGCSEGSFAVRVLNQVMSG